MTLSATQRFAAAQAALNVLGGYWLPFVALWFTWAGFDPSEYAVIVASGLVVRVFVTPFTGVVADALRDRRLVAGVLAVLAVALFLATAMAGAQQLGFWVILVAFTAAAAVHSSIGPIVEAATARAADQYGFAFARVRAAGSATFIAANLAGGWYMGLTGPAAFMWTVASITLVQALVFLSLPPLAGERDGTAPALRAALGQTVRDLRLLLQNRVFIVFLFATGLAQASHAVYYYFGTLNFELRGFSPEFIGVLFSAGVVFEVALLLAAPRFRARFTPTGLMLAGCVCAMVRWTGMSIDAGPWGALALQVLHAGSFGLVYLGTVHFITTAVPIGLAASSQSLYAVMSFGVLMAGATLAGGWLYGLAGPQAYLAMTGMSAASLVLTLLLSRIWKGGPLSLQERNIR
jgi:PPP family 3-phenylpropionic acid transporter